jgi:phosphate transport system substrate-binding protein
MVVIALVALVATGCGSNNQSQNSTNASDAKKTSQQLSGSVKIDGSTTVLPISEAVAEQFMKQNNGVSVTVGSSGTGGGFKKFIANEIDISDASRPISAEEKAAAQKNGIEYLEIPVAYDGISIIVNKDNTWASSITTAELKKIWEPGSKVKTWKDVRPSWPADKITLYGPSSAHGTFDYFTETINGKQKAIRTDYQVSEDYNVIVQGVEGDKGALGYVGYAYFKQNEDKLKVLSVDAGSGPVAPSEQTIKSDTYKPLSRQIYIYANKKSLARPEVKEFVKFYLTDGASLVQQVGYVPLNQPDYQKTQDAVNAVK